MHQGWLITILRGNLEIRHLQSFIALVEEGTFTLAARRMKVVQSTLSLAIKELEAELDTCLVERTTRRVSVTRSGRLYAQYARETLASLEAGVDAVRQDAQVVQGRLRLSILQSLEPYLSIPHLLKSFQDTFPRVELVVLNPENTSMIPSLVLSGELDVAFYPAASPRELSGLQSIPLVKDSLVVICAEANMLGSQSKVSLTQLEARRFIDLTRGRTLRLIVDQVFVSRRINRITAFQLSDEPTAVQFVEANLGIAILPGALARFYALSRKLTVLPIAPQTPPLPRWLVSLVCRPQRSLHGRADLTALFLELVRKQFSEKRQ